jgi:hypothetical protein
LAHLRIQNFRQFFKDLVASEVAEIVVGSLEMVGVALKWTPKSGQQFKLSPDEK